MSGFSTTFISGFTLQPTRKEEGSVGSAFNLGKFSKDMGVFGILVGPFDGFRDVRSGVCPVTVPFRCFLLVHPNSPQRQIPYSGKLKVIMAEAL